MSHKNSINKLAHPGLVLIGILLIATNLRGPITSIGPILESISTDLGLTATQAGLLTTVPLLAFAFFSPLSSGLARKIGLETALMTALIAITLGIIIRSLGSTSMLFLGTSIIGVGIAIGNVLLPSLLKRDFPQKVATLTAIYVLMMGIGSTISASSAIPVLHLAESLNITLIPHWAVSLASMIVLPIIAIVVWSSQVGSRTPPTEDTLKVDTHSYLWKTPAAWQVTSFLGLNSFMMYIFIAWLPTILVSNGYSEHQAGYLHGILQLATALPALVLIPLMAKFKDKRLLSVSIAVITFVGIAGLLFVPQFAFVWIMMSGFSIGGGFILGLSFVGIRTHDAHQAAALSGMAQCMGYLLAAAGPIIFGLLHEMMDSWNAPLVMSLIICIVWAGIGMFAGLPQIIVKKDNV